VETLVYQRAIEAAIETLIVAGTVAVGDISATGLSVEPLLRSGLAGVVYLEVLGFDPPTPCRASPPNSARSRPGASRKAGCGSAFGFTPVL
jgi:hypothetical protein